MKAWQDDLVLSATDLSNHLACRHLTTLDYAVARGEKAKPEFFDPRLDILRERGLEHERAYGRRDCSLSRGYWKSPEEDAGGGSKGGSRYSLLPEGV